MLLKENIQLSQFDQHRWVVSVAGDRHFLINVATLSLIRILSSARNLIDAHNQFNIIFKSSISFEAFEELMDEKLGGYEIIKSDLKPKKRINKNNYLKLKLPLFSSRVANTLSRPLQLFFDTHLFWFALSLSSIFMMVMFFAFRKMELVHVNYPLLMTLIYPTMLIHELGHIGACAKYKIIHGGIGFGFYFLLPVMYADITNIWMCSKEQRIIANLGGIFAELLYAGLLSILFLITGIDILLIASFSISTFVLFELNPFVRFDGYWILSDLANTPNLIQKSKEVMWSLLKENFWINWKNNTFNDHRREILLFMYGLVNIFFLFLLMGYTLLMYHNDIFQFPLSFYHILLKLGKWELSLSDLSGKIVSILLFYFLSIRFIIIKCISLKIKFNKPSVL
jgi:putative peptide zinc metalloprotease protein